MKSYLIIGFAIFIGCKKGALISYMQDSNRADGYPWAVDSRFQNRGGANYEMIAPRLQQNYNNNHNRNFDHNHNHNPRAHLQHNWNHNNNSRIPPQLRQDWGHDSTSGMINPPSWSSSNHSNITPPQSRPNWNHNHNNNHNNHNHNHNHSIRVINPNLHPNCNWGHNNPAIVGLFSDWNHNSVIIDPFSNWSRSPAIADPFSIVAPFSDAHGGLDLDDVNFYNEGYINYIKEKKELFYEGIMEEIKQVCFICEDMAHEIFQFLNFDYEFSYLADLSLSAVNDHHFRKKIAVKFINKANELKAGRFNNALHNFYFIGALIFLSKICAIGYKDMFNIYYDYKYKHTNKSEFNQQIIDVLPYLITEYKDEAEKYADLICDSISNTTNPVALKATFCAAIICKNYNLIKRLISKLIETNRIITINIALELISTLTKYAESKLNIGYFYSDSKESVYIIEFDYDIRQYAYEFYKPKKDIVQQDREIKLLIFNDILNLYLGIFHEKHAIIDLFLEVVKQSDGDDFLKSFIDRLKIEDPGLLSDLFRKRIVPFKDSPNKSYLLNWLVSTHALFKSEKIDLILSEKLDDGALGTALPFDLNDVFVQDVLKTRSINLIKYVCESRTINEISPKILKYCGAIFTDCLKYARFSHENLAYFYTPLTKLLSYLLDIVKNCDNIANHEFPIDIIYAACFTNQYDFIKFFLDAGVISTADLIFPRTIILDVRMLFLYEPDKYIKKVLIKTLSETNDPNLIKTLVNDYNVDPHSVVRYYPAHDMLKFIHRPIFTKEVMEENFSKAACLLDTKKVLVSEKIFLCKYYYKTKHSSKQSMLLFKANRKDNFDACFRFSKKLIKYYFKGKRRNFKTLAKQEFKYMKRNDKKLYKKLKAQKKSITKNEITIKLRHSINAFFKRCVNKGYKRIVKFLLRKYYRYIDKNNFDLINSNKYMYVEGLGVVKKIKVIKGKTKNLTIYSADFGFV